MSKTAFPIESLEDLPGRSPAVWRKSPGAVAVAVLAGIAWPPAILTFFVWPPQNWVPGLDADWRLVMLVAGLIGVPVGLWMISRERERTGRPSGRMGVVWRFLLYGGVAAAALQFVMTILISVQAWVESASIEQALGSTETILLLYGVVGIPAAILVGVSYALWAGMCVALIAFVKAPPQVRDRLGVLRSPGDQG